MAQDVEIGAKISVDADAALKQTLLLKDSIKQLSKEFKEAKAGSNEQVAAHKKLAAAQKELEASTKETHTAFGSLKEGLSKNVPAFEAASGSVSKFNGMLNVLKANPIIGIITLLAGVLKFLYDSFTNTTAGAKQADQVWAGLSKTFDVIKDVAFALGRAWLSAAKALFNVYEAAYKFLTLDFKGAKQAIKDAKDNAKEAYSSVKEAGEAAGKAFSGEVFTKAAQLKKDEQAINKERRAADEATIETNKKLLKSRELLTDTENKDMAAKKKAFAEVKEAEEKAAAVQIDLAKRTLANKQALFAMDKDGEKKHAQELSDLRTEIINKEIESETNHIKLNKQFKMLTKQDNEDAKAAAKEAADAEKEEKTRRHEYLNKLEKINQANELSLIRDTYEKELKILQNKISDENREIENSFKDGKLKQDEYNNLKAAQLKKANNELLQLQDKHNKELAKKEEEFLKELHKMEEETSLEGMADLRAKEFKQLEDGYVEKRAAIMANEKFTAEQKQKLVEASLEQERQHEKALQEKYRLEDEKKQLDNEKKAFEKEIGRLKKIATNEKEKLAEKIKALDAEEVALKKAFDKKIIDEEEYNAKAYELSNQRIAIAKLEADFKKAQINEIAHATTALSDVIGKQTAVGKGLAIATALINTYQGASEAIKQKSTLPSPFDVIAKIANVAAVIATGMKTVQAISSVNVPGGGGGGASAPNISAPILPQQQSTTLSSNSIQGVGNAAANAGAGRAYVLNADIQNNAERNEAINRAARLG